MTLVFGAKMASFPGHHFCLGGNEMAQQFGIFVIDFFYILGAKITDGFLIF